LLFVLRPPRADVVGHHRAEPKRTSADKVVLEAVEAVGHGIVLPESVAPRMHRS
jgi:hypothetical protein